MATEKRLIWAHKGKQTISVPTEKGETMAEYIEKGAAKYAVDLAMELSDTEYDAICNSIDKVHSADVAPVVHGRWDGDTCSVCKLPWNYYMTQNADDWGYFDPMPEYCPNCGAKMDGDKNGS